jgi:hypothetical protein
MGGAGGMPEAPAADAACDWPARALPAHVRAADADRRALADHVPGDSTDARMMRTLLRRPALPLGDIDGPWRVRSLQSAHGDVFGYPFFAGVIRPHPCGHAFAKTSGSQRRSGILRQGTDPDRLAFLGTQTVNDEPPRPYDPAWPESEQWPGHANSAGFMVRIGPDELLMVLEAHTERLEVYHLRH